MPTITKVYETYEQARQAVTDLELAGIPSSDISLVANEKYATYEKAKDTSTTAEGAAAGAVIGGTAGLLAGLGLVAIPGIGPVVAAGWLAATAVGAVTGSAAGGIMGAIIDLGVPEEHAQVYSESIRRGGALVAVRTDDINAERVELVLDRNTPIDPVLRREEYMKSGWTRFDSERMI